MCLLPVRRDYGGGGAGAGPGVVPTLRGHGVRAAVRRSCKYFPLAQIFSDCASRVSAGCGGWCECVICYRNFVMTKVGGVAASGAVAAAWPQASLFPILSWHWSCHQSAHWYQAWTECRDNVSSVVTTDHWPLGTCLLCPGCTILHSPHYHVFVCSDNFTPHTSTRTTAAPGNMRTSSVGTFI